VGPRAHLDRCGKSRHPPPTGIRSPDRPARTESLYRLNYPGSRHLVNAPNTKGTQCSAKAFVRMLARAFLCFLVNESQNLTFIGPCIILIVE